MVAVAVPLKEEFLPLQISIPLNVENNLQKLLFIHGEIERIKSKIAIAGGLTYRQLKRSNVLGISQYLLDSAERIVPLLQNLPFKIRETLIQRAGNWSLRAIFATLKLSTEAIEKILKLPIKPTVPYLESLLPVPPSRQWQCPIRSRHWLEIARSYDIKGELLSFLKREYQDKTLAELLDYLVLRGFDLKKLKAEKLEIPIAVESSVSELVKVSTAMAVSNFKGYSMVKLKGPIRPMKDNFQNLTYIKLCCDRALVSAKEKGLKSLEDYAEEVKLASRSEAKERGEKGWLDAFVYQDGMRIWFAKEPDVGSITGGKLAARFDMSDGEAYGRSGVERFLDSNQKAKRESVATVPRPKENGINTEQIDRSLKAAQRAENPTRTADYPLKKLAQTAEQIAKAPGELNGIKVTALSLQALTLGMSAIVAQIPDDLHLDLLKTAMRLQGARDRADKVESEQNKIATNALSNRTANVAVRADIVESQTKNLNNNVVNTASERRASGDQESEIIKHFMAVVGLEQLAKEYSEIGDLKEAAICKQIGEDISAYFVEKFALIDASNYRDKAQVQLKAEPNWREKIKNHYELVENQTSIGGPIEEATTVATTATNVSPSVPSFALVSYLELLPISYEKADPYLKQITNEDLKWLLDNYLESLSQVQGNGQKIEALGIDAVSAAIFEQNGVEVPANINESEKIDGFLDYILGVGDGYDYISAASGGILGVVSRELLPIEVLPRLSERNFDAGNDELAWSFDKIHQEKLSKFKSKYKGEVELCWDKAQSYIDKHPEILDEVEKQYGSQIETSGVGTASNNNSTKDEAVIKEFLLRVNFSLMANFHST